MEITFVAKAVQEPKPQSSNAMQCNPMQRCWEKTTIAWSTDRANIPGVLVKAQDLWAILTLPPLPVQLKEQTTWW